jgi:hypothetical protein
MNWENGLLKQETIFNLLKMNRLIKSEIMRELKFDLVRLTIQDKLLKNR